MKSKDWVILWREVDLDDVVRFYGQGFTPDLGYVVKQFEFTIDTHRRIVTFKLFIAEKDQ